MRWNRAPFLEAMRPGFFLGGRFCNVFKYAGHPAVDGVRKLEESSHESDHTAGIRWAARIYRCPEPDARARRNPGEGQKHRRQSSGSREGLGNLETDSSDRPAVDTRSRVFRARRRNWQ